MSNPSDCPALFHDSDDGYRDRSNVDLLSDRMGSEAQLVDQLLPDHSHLAALLEIDPGEKAPALDGVVTYLRPVLVDAEDSRSVLPIAILDLIAAENQRRDERDPRNLLLDCQTVLPGQLDLGGRCGYLPQASPR